MGASADGTISRQPNACLITCLMVGFVTIPVVSVLIVGVIKDAKINPQGPQFRLESATVPQLNINGSELTATWDMTIVAVNPNHKLSMSFDSLQATVF
ncbi:hypothetical protein C1H46_036369 [Malus baccata]|uniref:Late embryogenesis abundant protein LEA-2 subgroup domain-containing protein n=1 Tax=Malus baccata TaxID=106549 RepID=A0A540KV60_MALBA|nr:hypothetical protein C1H46_036369 [Malus baccata]